MALYYLMKVSYIFQCIKDYTFYVKTFILFSYILHCNFSYETRLFIFRVIWLNPIICECNHWKQKLSKPNLFWTKTKNTQTKYHEQKIHEPKLHKEKKNARTQSLEEACFQIIYTRGQLLLFFCVFSLSVTCIIIYTNKTNTHTHTHI